ncbi:uncharacterized protein MELLADRAFT_67074 [Melampsora larici-populina 98AG31]|uniref:SH3 domain-containing protein n=1 Tax=Melampsora larici-populina (strain 98AG31 / pathotype 3-4-7) TaxID=747676 RepID=F4S1P5_MELLP|nr:uncharacterized protein MELLADRAFT_67074 [Melampsora larici-populina 98AG31]EGG01412.1 hypothetical protein MELLADRAFT_67074 [Melampsora larici-populina 98AG31]
MTQDQPANSDTIYLNHIISQIHSNLSLLLSQDKISNTDVAFIKAKLPALASNQSATQDARTSMPSIPTSQYQQPVAMPVSQPAPPTQPNPPSSNQTNPTGGQKSNDNYKRAKAVWTYSGSAPDDLSFQKGDIIVILAEENADWWRGEHVDVIPSSNEPAVMQPPVNNQTSAQPYSQYQHNPPPTQYAPPMTSNYSNGHPQPSYAPAPHWQAPPYHHGQYQGDIKAPPMSGHMAPPPLQHTQSAPPTQVVVEKPKKKPFQGRLGQALVGGAGFGAGSAVASHVEFLCICEFTSLLIDIRVAEGAHVAENA